MAVNVGSNESNVSDNEYEVEEIISHKVKKGQRRFLIRWKNYSPSHDTWEDEHNLHCPDLLNGYLDAKRLPKK